MYFSMVDHPLKMLKNRSLFYEFYFSDFGKVLSQKLTGTSGRLKRAEQNEKVMNCNFVSNQEANKEIAAHLCDNKPFFLARYGATELSLCAVHEMIRVGAVDGYKQIDLEKGKRNSGIFPKDPEVMAAFTDEYIQALSKADMNAYWGSLILEEYLGKRIFSSECVQHTMRALEPFQYEEPWTAALEGKKVLVVHPFAKLIKDQYIKRDQLFENKKILPEYDLQTVQAIQSSGDMELTQHKTWIDALDALTESCISRDFDVALLSCGSYAVPLGARLKNAGKKAVVLGGMLQLVYGIKGTRWEQSRPDIVALYNDAWVRPKAQYKVKGTEKMADGEAYW